MSIKKDELKTIEIFNELLEDMILNYFDSENTLKIKEIRSGVGFISIDYESNGMPFE